MDLLRWLPLVVSMLCLGAFAWLAWRLLPPVAALAATFMYALMPHAYDWVIAGGGITRGVGLLFALLAMAVAADRERASSLMSVASGLLLGLAALSHPQAAVFGVIGCLIVSYQAPVGTWALRAGIAAASAVVLVLPWLLAMVATHGADALLAAGHRLEPMTGLIRMLNLRFSGAPFMDLFAVLGVARDSWSASPDGRARFRCCSSRPTWPGPAAESSWPPCRGHSSAASEVRR